MKLACSTVALVLATTLLTLSGSFASAEEVVYRWKDAQGNPVNSDRPPPLGVEYETISTSSSMVHAVDPAGGAAPSTVKPVAGSDGKAVDATKPTLEKNPEYCARAKDNLAQLDSNARIRMRNDQGEVHFLTEEEKVAERQKAQDSIKAFCG